MNGEVPTRGASGSDITSARASRGELTDSVVRLRKGLVVATAVWLLCGVGDWLVATFVQRVPLPHFLILRTTLALVCVLVWLRLWRKPMPSAALLTALDWLVFTSASCVIAVMCAEYRGIESPYYVAFVTGIIVRGIAIPEHRRRAARMMLPLLLGFPVGMVVASLLIPGIRFQFQDPSALATFALELMVITTAYVLMVFGGHVVWALRRQVYETRGMGRYRLKRHLGTGGMGEVWLARDPARNRDVAVKILRRDRHTPTDVARFEREIMATGELRHPNTVRIFDHGVTEDGLWYYVMEYLEGEDLGALVRREGPLAILRAARLVSQVARGLAEAHSLGIIHRDVKPENVFILRSSDGSDFVKLLDFGLAKSLTSTHEAGLTETGWTVGTPAFFAPEAAAGRRLDARSDVYSLGAVLYFALTGQPPFEGDNAAKLLHAHIHERPVPPSERAGTGFPDLDGVVMRCLEKAPRDRYPSCTELLLALAPFLDSIALSHLASRAVAIVESGAPTRTMPVIEVVRSEHSGESSQ